MAIEEVGELGTIADHSRVQQDAMVLDDGSGPVDDPGMTLVDRQELAVLEPVVGSPA